MFSDEISRLQALSKTIEYNGESWVEFDDEVTMIATVKEAK